MCCRLHVTCLHTCEVTDPKSFCSAGWQVHHDIHACVLLSWHYNWLRVAADCTSVAEVCHLKVTTPTARVRSSRVRTCLTCAADQPLFTR